MKAISRLNPYLWRYKKLLIPGLICAVLAALFSLLVPMVVRQAVDAVPRLLTLNKLHGVSPFGDLIFGASVKTLVILGVTILLLSIISGTFLFIMRQTVVVSSRHIEYDLRNEMYGHIQKLSSRFFQNYTTGDVIARSTSDIEQIRRYVGPALMYATRAIIITICALAVMTIISPSLTFYAMLPMPALVISIYFMSKMIHSRSQAIQEQYSSLTSRVQEVFAGIRVVKAYTSEDKEATHFAKESDIYRKRNLSLARVEATFRPLMGLIIGLSIIIVVWRGGLQVIEGVITIGNIAEYIIYVSLMTWPVASLGFVMTMVQRADASMLRLCEILDTKPDIADNGQTDHDVSAIAGDIVFKNVSYTFPGASTPALSDINFSIKRGQTLGIVGRTGSGKSTLINLIPRLQDVSSGTIAIDGHPIKSIPVDILRSSIGIIPQEAFLFSDSVGNNIAFGRLGADQHLIEQASSDADLLENISDFPDGFETMVGERGITLSGGQKQRASIARALIREPAILLLDDSLSAVDTATEAQILDNLKKHFGQRSIVIVSHRVSAIQAADLIIVLDEGKIGESGSHQELVEQGGKYADLYKKQLLELEIESIN